MAGCEGGSMKIRVKRIPMILFSLSCALCCIIGYKGYCSICFVDHYDFYCDTIIAHDEQQRIIAFLENNVHDSASLSSLAGTLHERFPILQSSLLQKFPSKNVTLTVRSSRPFCTLNGDLVLSDDGKLLSKELFSISSLKDKPNISTTTTDESNVLVHDLIHIPLELFEQFSFTWNSACELWLKDKKSPFSIVCVAHCLPDKKKLAQCKMVQRILEQRGTPVRKVPVHWVADIRFDKQIIVFSKRGEHG